MVSLRSAVWGPLLLAVAAVAVGACGAPSADEVRAKRATFVRDADRVCDTAIDELARGTQPSSYEALALRTRSGEETLDTAADDLHELRSKLGDSASDEIKTFDARVDPVLAATRRLGDNAVLRNARATRRSAERLRRAYDGLYRAAGAAKLHRCGRGGNRAADLALFTVYRDEYVDANGDAYLRLRLLNHHPGTFEGYRHNAHRALRLLTSFRKRLGRLSAPKVLRRSHRLLLRRATRALRTGHRLLAILDRGVYAAASGEAQVVLARFEREADRANAADRAVRRILGVHTSGRGSPSLASGDTSAA